MAVKPSSTVPRRRCPWCNRPLNARQMQQGHVYDSQRCALKHRTARLR